MRAIASGVWARLFMPSLVTVRHCLFATILDIFARYPTDGLDKFLKTSTTVVVDTNWCAAKGTFSLELSAARRARNMAVVTLKNRSE